MSALTLVDAWDVPHVAAAVLGAGGVLEQRGDARREFPLASVTKLLTAYAALVAVEEGAITLDEPAGPPGAVVRDLLSHAAGYGFESRAAVMATPRTRRIYSNNGYERLAEHVAAASGIGFAAYAREAVLEPLHLTGTRLDGSPAFGATSTLHDVCRFAAELLGDPRLVSPATRAEMARVQQPGLAGVLPGVGRFDPLDWGLGPELNFGRHGHWAGGAVSRATFGHFGGAGTFLWVDPMAGLACVCLTDREFGPWALQAWPVLCDAVVEELAGGTRGSGHGGVPAVRATD